VRDRVPRLLVVDPDPAARRRVEELHERAGWKVAATSGRREAMRRLFAARPDLVILDVAGDGWEALDGVRDASDVPVLVLSAADRELEKVRALRAGADDYLTKPFGPQELIARSEALLRRAPGGTQRREVHDDGRIVVDFAQRRVTVDGRDVALTPLEFRLLTAFIGHPRQVLSWEQLLDIAWRSGVGTRDQVKVYVGYLRRKLGQAGMLIRTVRGFGYRYDPYPP
jgi:DNA-binding response OmpR family regulator